MTEQEKWTKTLSLIPDGVQTLSKMPSKHIDGVYPKYIERGSGAYIYDSQGKEYIDYPLGLGAILLGHCHYKVVESVMNQLNRGNLFPLPSYLETEVAEKLCNLIPCAEMVRFLRNGTDATMAAIKVARAYTNREKIVCSGYHGWADWYNATTPKRKGCSKYALGSCTQIGHGNWQNFQKQIDKDVAAVILEPYILEEINKEFLEKVIEVSHARGAVVIFDEVITFLRTPGGSASKYFGVVPDMMTIGKALGNGFPISALCGKSQYMKMLENDCFVSSTFGGELTGMSAANAVLDFWSKNKVDEIIWERGTLFKDGFMRLVRKHSLDNTKIIGYPSRTAFKFPTELHKSLFWQECITRGVFLGAAQFISYAHDISIIDDTLIRMDEALSIVKQNWQNPKEGLHGKPAEETLRTVALNSVLYAEGAERNRLQRLAEVEKSVDGNTENSVLSNRGNAG